MFTSEIESRLPFGLEQALPPMWSLSRKLDD